MLVRCVASARSSARAATTAGGGPLEPRATSRTGSTVLGAATAAGTTPPSDVPLPEVAAGSASRSTSRSTAHRPSSAMPCAIVVSGGSVYAAIATSSKPTTLMSPGTDRPVARIARIAPIAIRSL